MSPLGCTREKEVKTLLERGQWPRACAEELRAHVEGCRVCSELVLVQGALAEARTSAMALPALPPAGGLWWRAQLRRRNEAIARIGKPLLGAEIFAVLIVALVAVCGVVWQLRRGIDLAEWLRALHLDTLWPASLASFDGGWWFLVPVLATLAVVSGVVVYFASEKL
jgi:hypothetical protein